jgi:hypothetical protein
MTTETLTFRVEPSDPATPLELSVWLNDQCCLPVTTITEPLDFSTEIADGDDKQYNLKIVMTGKTDAHTKIDDQGNIVQDALLKFEKFDLMGISIDQVVCENATYQHNHNGHSEDVNDKFFLSMGCNGTVEFAFTTPVYMWLLENL